MTPLLKKMYLSILTSILVLIVTVTTTYAWTGILTYTSTDSFDIGLEKSETSDYSIQISLDGVHFSDTLKSWEVKRAILKNMNLTSIDLNTASRQEIERLFSAIELLPLTTKLQEHTLGTFVSLEDIMKPGFSYDSLRDGEIDNQNHYFNFDIYLSFEYIASNDATEEVKKECQMVYLANLPNLMTSKTKTKMLSNSFQFANFFPDQVFNEVEISPASSARTAISKYEVVDKASPEQYEGKMPQKTYIYQGGTSKPTEVSSGVYSFGGIMPAEDNIGFVEYNLIHQNKLESSMLEEFRVNRSGDLSIEEAGQQWVIVQEDGLTIEKMIKLNISMWIEGFDGDCFNILSNTAITLNLMFSTTSKEEEE